MCLGELLNVPTAMTAFTGMVSIWGGKREILSRGAFPFAVKSHKLKFDLWNVSVSEKLAQDWKKFLCLHAAVFWAIPWRHISLNYTKNTFLPLQVPWHTMKTHMSCDWFMSRNRLPGAWRSSTIASQNSPNEVILTFCIHDSCEIADHFLPQKNGQTCLPPCRGGALLEKKMHRHASWNNSTREQKRHFMSHNMTHQSVILQFWVSFGHSKNTAPILHKFVMETLPSLDWMLVQRWSQNQSRCELATYLVICGYVNGSIVQALQLLGHQRHSEGCIIAGC